MIATLIRPLMAFLLLWAAPLYADPPEVAYQAKYWPFPSSPDAYPEMSDEKLEKRESFGVAFHGGGNRAAPAALGQLRALHDLGWIKKVRYISAISGGSWTAIPYTFLPGCDGSPELETFLGTYYPPADLITELAALDAAGETGAHKAFGPDAMLTSVSSALITRRFLRSLRKGFFDEAYARALEQIYFDRFDLGRSPANASDDERLFTWRKDDLDALLARNPDLTADDFYYVRCDKPYLIVGGTLLTKRLSPRAEHKFRMEMTPLYTGMPQEITLGFGDGTSVKATGGLVESSGYDRVTERVGGTPAQTILHLRQPVIGSLTNPTRLRFSLHNMAAVSGAAPQETILRPGLLNLITSNVGFPEHFVPRDVYTPPVNTLAALGQVPFEKEWAHADGGHEDNMGLAPHLAREVQNILAFVNTATPLDKDDLTACQAAVDQYQQTLDAGGTLTIDPKKMRHCEKMIGNDIPSFFFKTKAHIHNKSLSRLDQTQGADTALKPYYDVLSIAREFLPSPGAPSNSRGLSCAKYHAQTPRGVNYQPMICFAWLSQDQTWFTALKDAATQRGLPAPVQDSIRAQLDVNSNWTPHGRPERKIFAKHGFPHIGTFIDADWKVIQVVRMRALALANYTGWTLRDRADGIAQAFARNGLTLPNK